ncbi:aminotransferase class IV [Acuticoccus mangrovi]|uniref:Probable branched-chain-amino-acid aminotransferase n=1 Tax=Acuticoccus mangrovi TaxID=2796142 RepID=A0A934MH06_9HYPH|nr:aminotransferase class IV [Acuticoccus mangrovi]MBJ3776455.1 aminotransferase class IV [Acuticoccus mangrovi]
MDLADPLVYTSPDPVMADGAAYVDGAFCPIAEAKISVLDYGVTRSDCTYDVVGVWQGRFFRLDKHLDRFYASCARLRLTPPLEREALAVVLHELVARTGLSDAYVSMTCTRGRPNPAARRDPRASTNTLYAYAIPYVWLADADKRAAGLAMAIARNTERISRRALDQRAKNYHWLDLDMALMEALDGGADTVVLKDPEGNIAEGPGFNVFAYRDGVWSTPADNVLEGITRGTVIDLCAELNVAVAAGAMSEDDLLGAEEVMITSTAGGIIPVVSIDGRPVGDGRPGPHTARLAALYWDKHGDPAWSEPVRGLAAR